MGGVVKDGRREVACSGLGSGGDVSHGRGEMEWVGRSDGGWRGGGGGWHSTRSW